MWMRLVIIEAQMRCEMAFEVLFGLLRRVTVLNDDDRKAVLTYFVLFNFQTALNVLTGEILNKTKNINNKILVPNMSLPCIALYLYDY